MVDASSLSTKSINMLIDEDIVTQQVEQAATWMHDGKVLAYPTESVWGLGCDPFNQSAFMQILQLKNRPVKKGVILIGGDAEQLLPYIQGLPQPQRRLLRRHWEQETSKLLHPKATKSTTQQATTWLVPLPTQSMQQAVPEWIYGQHQQIALRLTEHPVIRALCQSFGRLLVSTSCNPATQPPAQNIEGAWQYFDNRITYLNQPTLGYQQPSRIVDALTQQVLR